MNTQSVKTLLKWVVTHKSKVVEWWKVVSSSYSKYPITTVVVIVVMIVMYFMGVQL